MENLENVTEEITDEMKLDAVKKYTNTAKNSTKFELKKASGGGLNHGLTVVVDSLNCGYLASSVYDGIKVIFLNISVIFMHILLFQVYVHHPETFPYAGQKGTLVNSGTIANLALDATMIES